MTALPDVSGGAPEEDRVTPTRRAVRRRPASRPARLLIGGLVLAGALTACGDGPALPGAAAVVGERRITVEQLQDAVEGSLSDPTAQSQLGGDRVGLQRQQLGVLVNRLILEEAASERGVTVTDGDVDARLAQFHEQAGGRERFEEQVAQQGVPADQIRPRVRDLVLDDALADELTKDVDVDEAELREAYQGALAQYDRVRTRHILVADEGRARRILAMVQADPSRFAELAKQYSTDTSNKDQGGELPLSGRGAFVEEFENAAFAAKPGETVVVKTQFGWHVLNVLERQTTTFEQARNDLRRQVLQDVRAERVREVLVATAKELGVKVNPRFGKWDVENGEVVPVEADPSKAVSSPEPGSEGPPAEGEAPLGEDPAQQPPAQEQPAQEQPAPTSTPAG